MDMQRICRGCWRESGPIDALIHCGDVEWRRRIILRSWQECPSYIVAGIMTTSVYWIAEMEFGTGRKQIFLTHGHYYGVSMGTEMIKEEGESRKADIVVFGHTHISRVVRYRTTLQFESRQSGLSETGGQKAQLYDHGAE